MNELSSYYKEKHNQIL